MRILQLTRDFPPAHSGIGDHVARLSAELAALGDEVVVVCAPPAEPASGVDLRTVAGWDSDGGAAIRAAAAAAHPDAVVWHYNPFQVGRRGLASGAGRLARALARIAPLTVVLHEYQYPWGRNGIRGLVWAVAQRLRLRGVVASATSIVLTTHARQRRLARRFPSRAATMSVVAAGATVEPTAGGEPPHALRARLGLPAGAFVVAHLGAIGEGRDLRPAVAAIEALRRDGVDARLLLAGRTGIAPPGGEAIVQTGPVDHATLSAALASSDCYLYAEPIGPVSRKTSLLSALAHGLPVLAYRGPDGEPDFRDGESLLLVEPDEDAVAAALRRLAADPALRRRLGEGARTLAETRYSWRAIAAAVRGAAARREHRFDESTT